MSGKLDPAITTVGVVFGGRSVEHRVSVRSARTVVEALEEAGFQLRLFGVDPDGRWVEEVAATRAIGGEVEDVPPEGDHSVAGSVARLTTAPPDVVFPLVHGTWGEDGTLQGLCEMLDLPYVGADVTSSAVAMDKGLAKAVLAGAGIPVVESALLTVEGLDDAPALESVLPEVEGPLFVKPSVGGSSVGITKVAERRRLPDAVREAFKFDDAVLVERAIEGREIECAVLGYPVLEASVLGEIIPGHEFYDYADKYLDDTAGLEAPVHFEGDLEDRIRATAVDAFAAVGGSGMARVDFLLEPNATFYVNEINTVPGFTSISMYPRLWALSGVPLPELVTRLVNIAVERHRDRAGASRSIRRWLDSLSHC